MNKARKFRHYAFLGFLALALVTGCADATYDKLRIGQQPHEYENVLPADKSRKTDFGRTYLNTDNMGRTDAMVLLLSRDQRICGKFQVTTRERTTFSPTNLNMSKTTDFRLRGELDPRLADMGSTGPIDALRAVCTDLNEYQGDRLAMDAHSWISAALMRIIQRWPNGGEVPKAPPHVLDLQERIPIAGAAKLSVNDRGVYGVEYSVGEIK